MTEYDIWFEEVESQLKSINMPLGEWQIIYQFDFLKEYQEGIEAAETAATAPESMP